MDDWRRVADAWQSGGPEQVFGLGKRFRQVLRFGRAVKIRAAPLRPVVLLGAGWVGGCDSDPKGQQHESGQVALHNRCYLRRLRWVDRLNDKNSPPTTAREMTRT